MNVPDYYKFLSSMDLHGHISSNGTLEGDKLNSSQNSDSNILFTALQVGKEIGLVLDSGI
jgi:hypothetical protein